MQELSEERIKKLADEAVARLFAGPPQHGRDPHIAHNASEYRRRFLSARPRENLLEILERFQCRVLLPAIERALDASERLLLPFRDESAWSFDGLAETGCWYLDDNPRHNAYVRGVTISVKCNHDAVFVVAIDPKMIRIRKEERQNNKIWRVSTAFGSDEERKKLIDIFRLFIELKPKACSKAELEPLFRECMDRYEAAKAMSPDKGRFECRLGSDPRIAQLKTRLFGAMGRWIYWNGDVWSVCTYRY